MKMLSMNSAVPMLLLVHLTTVYAASSAKITICHLPPGNPANFQTLQVAPSALRGHTDHGDLSGPCSNFCNDLCNDNNKCTIDACDAKEKCIPVAARAPTVCDDNVACTVDGCDPVTGCTHVPDNNACNDNLECTIDTCDPKAGCTNVPNSNACGDNVACTIDTCDPVAGCTNVPDNNACVASSLCMVATCDVTLDCQETPVVCLTGYSCNLANGNCDPDAPCVTNAALCDDGSLCTTDMCDPSNAEADDNGCVHPPTKICETGFACNYRDGQCVESSSVVPCVAVIDEWDNLLEPALSAAWDAFRTQFPNRPFCLLNPVNPAYDVRPLPSGVFDFIGDPLARQVVVNRDEGDPALASDWFNACDLGTFLASQIDYIALFIDTSGSMDVSTVQASRDIFFDYETGGTFDIREVTNPSENWIAPFMVPFLP